MRENVSQTDSSCFLVQGKLSCVYGFLVGAVRIELTTPTTSTWCSPTELRASKYVQNSCTSIKRLVQRQCQLSCHGPKKLEKREFYQISYEGGREYVRLAITCSALRPCIQNVDISLCVRESSELFA